MKELMLHRGRRESFVEQDIRHAPRPSGTKSGHDQTIPDDGFLDAGALLVDQGHPPSVSGMLLSLAGRGMPLRCCT